MGKKQDIKDLPRGLQIDTTTGPFDFDEEEKIMVPKKKPKKPIKAVLGVLALGAIGAKALSKAKKKTATATPNDTEYVSNKKNMVTDLYQKATKQETSKMNKGGGMDMGKKKRYAKKNQEELFGIEITDEPQAGYTVKKTKNLSTGGEVEVMRGGDYIKDLID